MYEPFVSERTLTLQLQLCHAPASSTYSMTCMRVFASSNSLYSLPLDLEHGGASQASHSTMWPKCYWQRPSNAPTVVLRRSGWYTQPLSWGLGSKPLQQRYEATRVQRVTQSQALYTHGLTPFEAGEWSQTVDMLSALCSIFCEHFCCWSDVKQLTKEHLVDFSTAVVNSFLACFCE